MANPMRGEAEIVLDGRPRVMRLTLGALAELEGRLGAGALVEVVERFESGRFTAGDLIALIAAGLRGAGAQVADAEVAAMAPQGGPAGAARAAARLLAAAFAPLDGA